MRTDSATATVTFIFDGTDAFGQGGLEGGGLEVADAVRYEEDVFCPWHFISIDLVGSCPRGRQSPVIACSKEHCARGIRDMYAIDQLESINARSFRRLSMIGRLSLCLDLKYVSR